MNIKTNKKTHKKIYIDFKILGIIYIPYFLFSIINSFYNYYLYQFFIDMSRGYAKIISVVIVYLLYILLLFLTKSSKKSNIYLLFLAFLLLILNEVKLFYMDMPIFFSDILYLFNMKEIMSFTGPSLFGIITTNPMFFIIQFLFFLFLLIFLLKWEDVTFYKVKRYYAVIPLILLIIAFWPSSKTNNFVLTKLLKSTEIKDYNYFTEDKDYYSIYGIVSGMYIQLLEERVFEPETYDGKIVEETMKKFKNDSNNNSKSTPNIILIFSESFWDIEKLSEIEFDKEITYNFRKLTQKGKLIEMISPSYGGRSSNVEFELLTGANTAFYNNAYIPYMRMYNNDSYYNKESIIKELKNNGYNTKILSTSSDKLYNCGRVYEYLKVDEVEYINNVEGKYIKGIYPSDDYVAEKIINDFNKKTNKPTFYMALTMQAHMPYTKDKYKKYDIGIKKSKLSEEENDVLLSYAQGIYDADQQLGKLYDFIIDYPEPTTIIFLGDHLPYLDTKNGENVINKLDYFNTDNPKLNIYRKYNTQALIISNYDIEYDNTKYLGPDILLAYLLQQNNMKLSAYYQYLLNTKKTLPTFNRYIAIDNNENLFFTNELPNDMSGTYKMRNNVQYHYFNKK